ncbi:BTB/POZ domain-containing protein 9-like isoform X3 [Adelges cooleyi]|uniref:BTB/POZ domain-containing protein 9-like isoform X3 n=1 Tax=Adelges cooleyi TaxID=133065 RepID=UPI00217F5CB8|nr:BTB/POZ domain-containing protein 9-like isoform X3 [Adelges cooleyi]
MMNYFLVIIILCSTPGHSGKSGYGSPPSSPSDRRYELIDHTEVLVEFISKLHLSNRCSDVVLVVGKERLPAHRIILASQTEYFRRIFFEDYKESHKSVVNLSDAPVTSFEILHKYIYTGRINLGDLKKGEVFELLKMSDYFGISNLKLSLHKYLKNHSNEHIDHTGLLVEFIRDLYLSDRCSDVVLVVGKERLPAHRIILASHSEYFRRVFYEDDKESHKSEVNLSDAPVTSFEILLKYIYTGRINLGDLEGEEVFELLRISVYYGILNLKLPLHEYLKSTLDVENAWSFLAMTRTYKYNDLEVESLHFIDNHASEVLHSEDFLSLSPEVLQDIIIRDSFYCNELDIFHAVCRWINIHQNSLDHNTKMKVLSAIRYPLMSVKELAEVRQSPLVKTNKSLYDTIFRNTSSPDKLQYRGQLKPNVDLIHRPRDFLFPIPSNTPVINGTNGSTTITLHDPSFINYIVISLPGRDCLDKQRYYSYYIDVSMDQTVWFRAIDHSNYNCRSAQNLWIESRIVRYIRVVGTANETFEFSSVKYNTEEMHEVEIKNGLVVPKYGYNVASSFRYAFVIKGEHNLWSQSMLNVLVDDYYDRYDNKIDRLNMYTYHNLQSGCIVIHLAQPYILSSMRFLLWGGNDQFYKYTVEDSINNQDWKWIANETKELKQSWQVLKFTPRPILYIRITGVYNSAGNDFRILYFEAPARVIVDDRGKNNETDVTMTEASTSNPVV